MCTRAIASKLCIIVLVDLRYVIDVNGGNCTVESMAGVTPSYAVAGPWDPAGVNADKSPGLFDLSAFGEFYYQEQASDRRWTEVDGGSDNYSKYLAVL